MEKSRSWSSAHDWKSCNRKSGSRVRIPPSPPFVIDSSHKKIQYKLYLFLFHCNNLCPFSQIFHPKGDRMKTTICTILSWSYFYFLSPIPIENFSAVDRGMGFLEIIIVCSNTQIWGLQQQLQTPLNFLISNSFMCSLYFSLPSVRKTANGSFTPFESVAKLEIASPRLPYRT